MLCVLPSGMNDVIKNGPADKIYWKFVYEGSRAGYPIRSYIQPTLYLRSATAVTMLMATPSLVGSQPDSRVSANCSP